MRMFFTGMSASKGWRPGSGTCDCMTLISWGNEDDLSQKIAMVDTGHNCSFKQFPLCRCLPYIIIYINIYLCANKCISISKPSILKWIHSIRFQSVPRLQSFHHLYIISAHKIPGRCGRPRLLPDCDVDVEMAQKALTGLGGLVFF